MNLETQIKPELWAVIARSYEWGNYTHAISDAMALVTDVLRDKSGLDGDGDALVGKALGFSEGKSPLIKINNLQSQTEQDEQRGFMFVLKGMYALVRNTRIHERREDTKETADTVIKFIDYLLDFLGTSQQSFTIQDFVSKVTEKYFVVDGEYVGGLVDTIPVRKLGDVLIAVYRVKSWGTANGIKLVISTILARLDDTNTENFLMVISEELMKVDNAGDISLIIKIIPASLWPRLSIMSRLRAENILADALANASYDPENKVTLGIAASWLSVIAEHVSRKGNLSSVICNKFMTVDFRQHNFVAKYLLYCLEDFCYEPWEMNSFVSALSESILNGNNFVKKEVVTYLSNHASADIVGMFVDSLAEITDPENPEMLLPENGPNSERTIPFLGKFVAAANPSIATEDEIPF